MTSILTVLWTVKPTIPPQPYLPCSTCNALKPFRSSGKVRVNANGKRIDAWLIYNCTTCDTTWNCPILERRNIRTIDPVMLETFQSNDAEWTDKLAFDARHLRRRTTKVNEFTDVDVQKEVLCEDDKPWTELNIVLRVPLPTKLRLDRLLANELAISRQRVFSLVSSVHMHIVPAPRRALRRPIKDQTSVRIDLQAMNDGPTLAMAAAFEC